MQLFSFSILPKLVSVDLPLSSCWEDGDWGSQLGELGEVKHIVSPNYEHIKYAAQWIDAFPAANSYGAGDSTQASPEPSTGYLGYCQIVASSSSLLRLLDCSRFDKCFLRREHTLEGAAK